MAEGLSRGSGSRRRYTTEGGQGSTGVDVTVTPTPRPALLQEWDRFVDTVHASDVAQLSAWARIREYAGFRPL